MTENKTGLAEPFWDSKLGYWIHQGGMLALFLGILFIPLGLFAVYFCEECITYQNGFEYAKIWFPISSFIIGILMWLFHADDIIKWIKSHKTRIESGKA